MTRRRDSKGEARQSIPAHAEKNRQLPDFIPQLRPLAMKFRHCLVLPLLTAVISVPGLRAQDAKPAAPAAPAAAAEKPETELEKTMGKMGKAWKQVRRAARDGKLTVATADLVTTIRINAEAATKLTPALEAERPAADQAKFQADYVAQMKKLIGKLSTLEATLKAGDTATATKLVAEVGDLMKSGHKDFRKPEEH